MSEARPRNLRFGVFELDLRAGELRRNGSKLKLQEQPFQVLAALVEKPGEVLLREELKDRLWADDTFVDFDHSLSTAINKIRQVLGDSATHPLARSPARPADRNPVRGPRSFERCAGRSSLRTGR